VEIVRALTEQPGPARVLRSVYAHDLLARGFRMGEAASRDLADRLIEAGLPSPAARVLQPHAESRAPETVLLRARIALAENDPARALALVAGRGDAPAARLRAEAHARLGDHAAAAEIYADAAAPEDAARAAWRAGDAARVASTGTDAERALARRLVEGAVGPGDAPGRSVEGPPTDGPGPTTASDGTEGGAIPPADDVAGSAGAPTLRGSAELIADSRDLRAAIADLLAEKAAPQE
jgi:hypothetical protein